MNITCSRNDLVKAVNIVSKAVSSKTSLPILECILLKSDGNKLILIGNDMDLGIKTSIDARIKEEGELAVNSKLFSEIIRRLPDEKAQITADDAKNIVIESGKAKFNIKGQNAADFPALPETDAQEQLILGQKELRDMVKNTIFAIAPEDSGRPILTGELFDIREGKLYIVSVDGFRIAMRSCPVNYEGNKKVVIPGKALSEVQKIMDDDEAMVKICFSKKHAVFNIEETTVITRLLDGEFLQYQASLDREGTNFATIKTKDFLEAVDRAALISRESKNSPIKMEFSKKKLSISSNTENESVFEEVESSFNADDMTIAFNPKFVLDALKCIESETIRVYLGTPFTPCIIEAEEDITYKYLILPIRLHN